MAHEKEYVIVVNGTEQPPLGDPVVTYQAVVDMAFPNHPVDPNVIYLVVFDNADSKPHQGTLAEGGSVTVKKKHTIFDVTPTNKS